VSTPKQTKEASVARRPVFANEVQFVEVKSGGWLDDLDIVLSA
jgi:hypothetical protein